MTRAFLIKGVLFPIRNAEKIKPPNSRPSSGNLWQIVIRQTLNVGPATPQIRLNRIYQILPKPAQHLGGFIFSTFLMPFLFLSQAEAVSKQEMKTLNMFFTEDEMMAVSPARKEKPLSLTAENVTVVTAEEIEAIQAHTLADVLYYIPGVQMDIRSGPGSGTVPHIQGSEGRHVRVIVDGVTLNNLSSSIADIGAIPVQNIEKIEIIKGPASSAWGSSLGGVINIITKPAGKSGPIGGTVSTSFGEGDTIDSRLEASGRAGSLGYYLNFNKLRSDGLTPNTPFDSNNFYSKLKWDVTEKADLLFTLGYNDGFRGQGEYREFDLSFHHDFEYLYSSLALNMDLWEGAGASFSLRTLQQDGDFFQNQRSTGAELQKDVFRDSNYGGSAQFTWKKGRHHLAAGVDVDEETLESNAITGGDRKKWAFFANDTVRFRRFSITPGVRFDHTSTNGDFFSPSLGLTWRATDATLLRFTVARGFNAPPFSHTFGTTTFFLPNPDLDMEKVWSYQAGVETTALKFLWIKAGLFRHEIRDAIATKILSDEKFTKVNEARQRRQGGEIEMKTLPFYHTSLFTGFTFVEAKDLETGERIPGVGRVSSDVGLEYDNKRTFRAVLKGHYMDWNDDSSIKGRHGAFIWDLYLNKQLYTGARWNADAFLGGRNLLNSSQYLLEVFKNPGRWIEGGIKVRF